MLKIKTAMTRTRIKDTLFALETQRLLAPINKKTKIISIEKLQ